MAKYVVQKSPGFIPTKNQICGLSMNALRQLNLKTIHWNKDPNVIFGLTFEFSYGVNRVLSPPVGTYTNRCEPNEVLFGLEGVAISAIEFYCDSTS